MGISPSLWSVAPAGAHNHVPHHMTLGEHQWCSLWINVYLICVEVFCELIHVCTNSHTRPFPCHNIAFSICHCRMRPFSAAIVSMCQIRASIVSVSVNIRGRYNIHSVESIFLKHVLVPQSTPLLRPSRAEKESSRVSLPDVDCDNHVTRLNYMR